MEEIQITIVNWDKHQTKSDWLRHPHWFKIKNDMPSSNSLFSLSAEQKWAWVCMLCVASKKNTGTIKVSLDWLSSISGVCKQSVLQMVDFLIKNGTLTKNRQKIVRKSTTDKNRIDKNRIEIKEKPASLVAVDFSVFKISEQLEPYQLHALEQTYPQEFLAREFKLLKASLVTRDKPLPSNKTHWYRLIASHMKREWLKEPPQKITEVRVWDEDSFL